MSAKSRYEKLYLKPERFIMFNEDDVDLAPIKVPTPVVPEFRSIGGYGKSPEDQKFQKPVIPQRLLDLEEEIGDLEAIEKFLQENQVYYADEIAFIEREWERRDNGYWFFNNGVATYITGTHYLYISYWEIDVGIPDYRDRDRRFFVFLKFSEDDKDSMGVVYPKHRREGATHKAATWVYDSISTSYRALGGIQSATEGHAKDVFQLHLVPGWKSLPFFFKPKFEGSTNPKAEMSFNEPSTKITKGKMSVRKGKYLGSKINFRSSDTKAYDSRKLKRYHGDEVGKTTEIDVNKRHGVVKECLVENHRIVGKAIYTSTVEDMDKGGGANFKKICDQSHYDHWDERYSRDKNGRTVSGMYLLFMPAQDGFLVDEYGNSKIKESLQILNNRRQGFIDKGDDEGLSGEIRKYPTRYRECWRGDASECKFNIQILETILDKYKFGNSDLQYGNFEYTNGLDSRVVFVPHDKGKFAVSYLFNNPADSNKFFMNNGRRIPANTTKFIAGADPFKFKSTKSSNKSDGGGAVFMRRDGTIDPEDKDVKEWQTNRFVVTYRFRPPSKEAYCEDMLKMCIYYGCQMNTETNVDAVWEHFERRGYHRYLWYKIDSRTGSYEKNPGTYTDAKVKETIYREFQQYILVHGLKEKHSDLMQECYEIGDDMGPYDLFAAGGMCLIEESSHKPFINLNQDESDSMDYDEYVLG